LLALPKKTDRLFQRWEEICLRPEAFRRSEVIGEEYLVRIRVGSDLPTDETPLALDEYRLADWIPFDPIPIPGVDNKRIYVNIYTTHVNEVDRTLDHLN
jgi:hypothetical protein